MEVGGVEPPSAMGSTQASTTIAGGFGVRPRPATTGNRWQGRKPYISLHPRARGVSQPESFALRRRLGTGQRLHG